MPLASHQALSVTFSKPGDYTAHHDSVILLSESLGEMAEALCLRAGRGELLKESQRWNSFSHPKASNTGPVQKHTISSTVKDMVCF